MLRNTKLSAATSRHLTKPFAVTRNLYENADTTSVAESAAVIEVLSGLSAIHK
jgi:hypothetical protein